MNIKYCDKCGKHVYFSDTLIIQDGLDNNKLCSFDICSDCTKK